MLKKSKIFIVSGGTGGHIIPARCLAEELCGNGFEVLFLGDQKYQGYIKRSDKFQSKIISSSQFVKSPFLLIKALLKISIGVFQSILLILIDRPKKIVSFGGYATFPILVAGLICRIDVIIHEQNAHLGKVNRIFAKHAKKIALSFKETSGIAVEIVKKTKFTGNPIRQEIIDLKDEKYILPKFKPLKIDVEAIKNDNRRMGYDVILASDFQDDSEDEVIEDSFNILVVGGSGGAKIFSEILPKAFFNLNEDMKEFIQIVQQCRKELIEETFDQYRSYNVNITMDTFFDNMPELIRSSHLIIARSGSSSIFEFCAAKKPMILVPFAASADGHQEKNAKYMEKQGAAIVIREKEFTINKINSTLKNLMDSKSILNKMSKNASDVAMINATKNLAELVKND